MKLLVACLVAVVAVSAANAATPKPWQWKPAKVETRLKASSPLAPTDVGSAILTASCVGKGKGAAGRFSRFICQTRWGGSNGSYASILTIRVLAVGTGKLCVVTTPEYKAIPWTAGTQGTRILPQRACPLA